MSDYNGKNNDVNGQAIEHLAESLRKVADANEQLADRLPTRAKARLIAAVGLVALLTAVLSLIVLFDVRYTQHQAEKNQQVQLHILDLVNGAVGPAATARSTVKLQAEIDHLIGCIENHADRDAAQIRNIPIPPLQAGCPPDSLGST